MTSRLRGIALGVSIVASACADPEGAPPPVASCEPPTGCVHADRVDGACRCLVWQAVSVEPVPVKYVVVGVLYSPLGDESMLAHGFTPARSPPEPTAASDFGARWRSVVRARDGSEVVATLGPGDLGSSGTWGPLIPVTETSATLSQPSNVSLTSYGDTDVSPHELDLIFIWINPAAAVTTDYVGNKSVSWSWTSDCSYPDGCLGPWVFPFYAGQLSGAIAASNPYMQAMLAAFDAADRSTILAFDPYFDPPGRDPSTIPADPRFQQLGAASLGPHYAITPPLTWTPCPGTLTDAGFEVMAETEVPFGAGETLVLQHSVLSTSASCTPQLPGLYFASSAPECMLGAEVLVDRMFGTLLMLPTSVGAACSKQ